MKPQDVQIPKGMKLLCTVVDFCRITNFTEPEDVLNLGGAYKVTYRVCTWYSKPKEVTRSFQSKTYADRFIDLLRECTGVVVIGEADFKIELCDPRVEGMRLVNAYGSIEEAVRGVSIG